MHVLPREGTRKTQRAPHSWLIPNKPLTHEAWSSGLLSTSGSAMTNRKPSVTPTHKMQWEWLIVQDWISPAWFTGNLNGIRGPWTGNLGFGLEMDPKPWGEVQVGPSQSESTASRGSIWRPSSTHCFLRHFLKVFFLKKKKNNKNNIAFLDISGADSVSIFIKNMFTSPPSILIW